MVLNLMNKKSKCIKTKAFSLPEILIVLSVLAMIVSISMPTLIQSLESRDIVLKLKKANSNLSHAFNDIISNGNIIESFFLANTSSNTFLNELTNRMNAAKVCGTASLGCFPNVTYKYLDNTDENNFESMSDFSKAVLQDSTLIAVYSYKNACTSNGGSGPKESLCGYVIVDLNGAKSPNQEGRDLFWFDITPTGIFPEGTPNDGWTCSGNGYGCAAKVLKENAINY